MRKELKVGFAWLKSKPSFVCYNSNCSSALFWLARCLWQFASQNVGAGCGSRSLPQPAPTDNPSEPPQVAKRPEELLMIYQKETLMLIDFHTHIFPPDVCKHRERYCARDSWFASLYSNPHTRLATAEDLIAEMDISGV